MEYKNYRVEDFVLDQKFRKWILEDDSTLNDFWTKWMEENPQKVKVLKEAREVLLNVPEIRYRVNDERVKKLWHNIESLIEREASDHERNKGKLVPINTSSVLLSYQDKKERKSALGYKVIAQIAAVLIVAIAAAYFFVEKNTPEPVPAPVTEKIVKSNAWGQKTHVFLHDGSEVILNSGSKIEYDKYFTSDKREIHLTGEAYFIVEKDPARPFVVKTKNLATTALGTEFNVRAYENEKTSVTLAEGKVKVVAESESTNAKQEQFVLTPGEGIVYESPSSVSKFNFDRKEFLAWKDGLLYFDNAGEEEVYRKLEQWYGVNINTVNRSTKSWGYTGEFHKKSLELVLISLSIAMDFQFEIRKDSVEIIYN